MMSKKEYAFWVCAFYITTFALLAVGTFYDLAIDAALYNPVQKFSLFMQNYGEAARWGLWGPASAILFASRAWECETTLTVLGKIFKNMSDKTRNVLMKIADIGYGAGFLALGYFGWQKLIKNVVKHWFSDETKETAAYTVVLALAVIAVDLLTAFLTKKLVKPETLKKVKALAYGGIIYGILYRAVMDPVKSCFERTRYYQLLEANDMSLFTRWYVHGNGGDSFPSGHAGSAAATFLSLTLCDRLECCKNKERLFFILSWGYTCIMMYSRMVMGKHYLTDVAAGAILGFTFVLIARELFVKRFCEKVKL